MKTLIGNILCDIGRLFTKERVVLESHRGWRELSGRRWMKAAALPLAMIMLAGCASTQPQPAPVDTQIIEYGEIAADGVHRRSISIGVLTDSEGLECPGADIDAYATFDWCAHMDRRTLILDQSATIANVTAQIQANAQGMSSNDLLCIFVSSHGTTRPDESGDEANGQDEGVCMYDGVWWDDDIWLVLQHLPCRVFIFSDTCHAEGSWRRLMRGVTFGLAGKPRWVQLELDLGDPRSTDGKPDLLQFAMSREEEYAFGNATTGGTGTMTYGRKLDESEHYTDWFLRGSSEMPANQQPAWTGYGDAAAFALVAPLH
jgi:hypothetical protein